MSKISLCSWTKRYSLIPNAMTQLNGDFFFSKLYSGDFKWWKKDSSTVKSVQSSRLVLDPAAGVHPHSLGSYLRKLERNTEHRGVR